ncbi:uncharacterized protein LOC144711967 [Wolffia australiana]
MEKAGQSGYKEKKKKKQKDGGSRLKQAEKKKRRLEKALAASAALRSELEKKKQMKLEEQRRLDQEGAAIAEAVALHVLLGEEDSDDCASVDFFMGRGWSTEEPIEDLVGHVAAAETLSALRISEGSNAAGVRHPFATSMVDRMLGGGPLGWEVDFYRGF